MVASMESSTGSVRFKEQDAPSPNGVESNEQTSRPNSTDVTAKLEQKRLEHEKQRFAQQQAFEAQMRALEEQQAAEEAALLASSSSSSESLPMDKKSVLKAPAQITSKSAPATPPRSPSTLSSTDDEKVEASADYQRMTQSVAATMGRQRVPLDESPPLSQDQARSFNYKSKSKSGTDLSGFSAALLSASANGVSSIPAALRQGNQTAPNSPITDSKPTGTTGHIGSGATKQNQVAKSDGQSKSVPGSRRASDSEADDQLQAQMHNSVNITEGLSKMSVNGLPRKAHSGTDAPLLTSFLFDDEMDNELNSFGGKYLALNTDDDKFPILVRRDSFPGILSASSAALDLAPLSQTPPRSSGFLNQEGKGRGSEWPLFQPGSTNTNNALSSPGKPYTTQKGFSVEAFASPGALHASVLPGGPVSPSQSRPLPPPGSGRTSPVVEMSSPGKRNAGLTGVLGTPTAPNGAEDYRNSKRSSLMAPPASSSAFAANLNNAFANPYIPYANGSGPSSSAQDLYTSEFGQLGGNFNSPNNSINQKQYGNVRGLGNSTANPIPNMLNQKRIEEVNRFAGLRLEDLQGDMASLCKDQHGCRFLQRKLEEGNAVYRDMIFAEVYPHFAELMVDSFGNYLAQRLLEYSTDEQKDILLASIHDDLVNISLNIHGTRAIQRLIDHLTTQRQVQTLISALNMHVVTLIKDLNGNHVIQKCLNSLKPEDNQFIYNAVAESCVEVATHRHGCCVLQRCIDHASESQRIQLVTEITYHCLTLVQDPFSNYVVQYCLEFDRRFVEAIIRQFHGNVCALSCHKFSSNVIEKCIRVADPEGRRLLVTEILERGRLERLVKDLYANYVVQTACDYADPVQREQLIQQIRPLLPSIRNTPYGKRIAARIQKATPSGGQQRFVSYPMSGGFAYPSNNIAYGSAALDGPFNAFAMPPNFGYEAHHHQAPPTATYTQFL